MMLAKMMRKIDHIIDEDDTHWVRLDEDDAYKNDEDDAHKNDEYVGP